MRKLLLLLFVSLVMNSCDENGLNPKKIQKKEDIYYKINKKKPFTGKTVEYYQNKKIKIQKIYRDGILKTEISYDETGKNETEINYDETGKKGNQTIYSSSKFIEERWYYYNNNNGYLQIEEIKLKDEDKKIVKIYEENGIVVYEYKTYYMNSTPEVKLVSHIDLTSSNKKFELNLSSENDCYKYKIKGFFDSDKNVIRVIHFTFNEIRNKIEEWNEVFEIKLINNNHIITEPNYNGEYLDLDWDKKEFYFIDREGIIPTY